VTIGLFSDNDDGCFPVGLRRGHSDRTTAARDRDIYDTHVDVLISDVQQQDVSRSRLCEAACSSKAGEDV